MARWQCIVQIGPFFQAFYDMTVPTELRAHRNDYFDYASWYLDWPMREDAPLNLEPLNDSALPSKWAPIRVSYGHAMPASVRIRLLRTHASLKRPEGKSASHIATFGRHPKPIHCLVNYCSQTSGSISTSACTRQLHTCGIQDRPR